MESITREELEAAGGIYIEQVIYALQQYKNKTVHGTYEEYEAYFLDLHKRYPIYADFYYNKINEENIDLFKEHLTVDQMQDLEVLCKEGKESGQAEFVIFIPNERQLRLLLLISYKELLFSTFYIMELPLTIWSNYDGEFVAFAKEEKILGGVLCNY